MPNGAQPDRPPAAPVGSLRAARSGGWLAFVWIAHIFLGG